MMLKNYNYMLTIILYPFILALSYLRLINYLKSNLYTYLIAFMIIIFIPSFIMSLYSALDEILYSKKKWRVIPLVFLSIFYLPIYYTKYVSKEEKYLGIIVFIITIPLAILTINAGTIKLEKVWRRAFKNYVVVNENYVQMASNNLFSLGVDKTFRCNNEDIGDYVISCDRLEDDSFIGIYSYDVSNDSEEDIVDKLDFHIGQTIDYIEESDYTYELIDTGSDTFVEIDYNENAILITQNTYLVNNIKYSLIIMKELKKELVDYNEYQKMIDSIYFLNYNVGVSS